jgi:hypothetical protein
VLAQRESLASAVREEPRHHPSTKHPPAKYRRPGCKQIRANTAFHLFRCWGEQRHVAMLCGAGVIPERWRRRLRSLCDASSMTDPKPVLRIGPLCLFCTAMLDADGPRAAIKMFDPKGPGFVYQLDAHIECLRQAAHPNMAERVDEGLRRVWRA